MNPYEMQRRMAKACALADKAEQLGFLADELAVEHPKGRETLAKMCGVKPCGKPTDFLKAKIILKYFSFY